MIVKDDIICRGSIVLGTGCGDCSRCEQELKDIYNDSKSSDKVLFVNTSSYEFTDISSEEYRTYEFIDKFITLEKPLKLAVSGSGHRVFTTDGLSHYIPNGWVRITWKAKLGSPNFVK